MTFSFLLLFLSKIYLEQVKYDEHIMLNIMVLVYITSKNRSSQSLNCLFKFKSLFYLQYSRIILFSYDLLKKN